jgi:DNA replication regulator DPB11
VAIAITGFSGADLLHIERLIELLGAQFYNTLTRKRSLLLCPDRSIAGTKTIKAKEWGIPIVSVDWFWEVISNGDEEVDISTWSDNSGRTSPFAIY